MKEKVIKRTMALFLTAVLCTGLCTGFTVNAEETDAEVKSQTEQAETIQKDDISSENLPGETDIIETEAQEPEASEEPEEQNEEVELSEETEHKLSSQVPVAELSDPKIGEDSSMTAGQKVTWDCVWFGSYPQSEVTSSDSVYSKLQDDSGWENNEITLNGSRYRRMKEENATYSSSYNGYYSWSDSATYHYFKYEPIKWRVLKVNEEQALLLSDVALDDKQYNTVNEAVTWETSTIRSWLNGYGASLNQQKEDYSGKGFIDSAFTSEEQSVIVETAVVNANNIIYNNVPGGNDTIDKVFFCQNRKCTETMRCLMVLYRIKIHMTKRADAKAVPMQRRWEHIVIQEILIRATAGGGCVRRVIILRVLWRCITMAPFIMATMSPTIPVVCALL